MEMQFSELTMAAWGGQVSGTGVRSKQQSHPCSMTSYNTGEEGLKKYLPQLAEGGYVIDLQPLAEHASITSWVMRSPMPSGDIDGDEIDRLSNGARESATMLAPDLEGDFQGLALLASIRFGESDGQAGPFDYVSAAYRAAYWGSKGARIGKRVGNVLYWSDGIEQAIEEKAA